jgi:zinc/manganese transport system substrate-binding protein
VAFAAYVASMVRRRLVAALALAALLVAACGPAPAAGSGKIEVVAAENFWGNVAAQVGGDRVHVTSVIANPATDPHDYDPTPGDARLFAQARYVIVNGAGYDAWAEKVLEANPTPGRKVLDVGRLAGLKEGANPHTWYSPSIVKAVIDRIAADLGDAASGQTLWDAGFKDYRDGLDAIRKYAGTKVGATESIFAYLARETGLDLITPSGYMNAVSEGADPGAADKAEMLNQIATRQIKVLVYNVQNSTPEVQDVVARARANQVPVVQITETLAPAGASFQTWQAAQLQALLEALAARA